MADDHCSIPVEPLGGLDERFCEVMDAAPVMIWVSGEDKLCSWFNKPWLQFTGRTMTQELGNGWAEGIHPEDLERCLQIYISHFDDKKHFRMRYRLRHHNGEYRWIDDIGAPRYARDGRFLGYVGSCIDIHSHRAAQEELRNLKERLEQSLSAERAESARRLQEALSAGSVLAFEWDVSSDTTRRSDNAPQLLGPHQRQFPTGASFLARINPDDRARYMATLAALSPDNPTYSTTYRFTRPDGREIWLEDTAKAEFDSDGHMVRLSGLGIDVTQRKQAEIHQRILVAVDHRVKNVLARVAAIVTETRESSQSMDDFVKTLGGRLQSMAAAHEVLSRGRWQGVGITDLIRDQLAPYAAGAHVTIQGPDTILPAASTQALAMVFHELATNAVKFGALSTPRGRVSVTWDTRSGGNGAVALKVEWREEGGPRVAKPIRSGFGTSLIDELISHELGGTADLAFEPDGVSCRMTFPIE